MKQALHIFKKDVRYLRYEIAITLVAAAVFCFIGLRRGLTISNAAQSPAGASFPISILLPVTWWFLITRVVNAESPTDNKQFWLTRPYQWKSLLGAKALFILVFVNLPLLLADVAILPAFGFSPGQELAGLLWTQLLVVVAFALPTTALSSIMRGIATFLTVVLLISVGVLASALFSPAIPENSYWGGLEWIQIYYALAIVAAAGTIVLFWQYTQRKTVASRTLAGIAASLIWLGPFLIPWTSGFALQMRLSHRNIDASSIHIGLDLDRKWLGHIYSTVQEQTVLDLPLQIGGVPSGMELKANGLAMVFQTSAGEISSTAQPPQASVTAEAGILSLRAVVADRFYAKVKNRPIQLRGTLFFTLYGNRHTTEVPLDKRPVRVAGMGACSSGAHFVLCSSAFRAPPDLVSMRLFVDSPRGTLVRREQASRLPSFSPFPAEPRVSPVAQFFEPQGDIVTGVIMETSEPLAYLRRGFQFDNVRLSDFESHASTITVK